MTNNWLNFPVSLLVVQPKFALLLVIGYKVLVNYNLTINLATRHYS